MKLRYPKANTLLNISIIEPSTHGTHRVLSSDLVSLITVNTSRRWWNAGIGCRSTHQNQNVKSLEILKSLVRAICLESTQRCSDHQAVMIESPLYDSKTKELLLRCAPSQRELIETVSHTSSMRARNTALLVDCYASIPRWHRSCSYDLPIQYTPIPLHPTPTTPWQPPQGVSSYAAFREVVWQKIQVLKLPVTWIHTNCNDRPQPCGLLQVLGFKPYLLRSQH